MEKSRVAGCMDKLSSLHHNCTCEKDQCRKLKYIQPPVRKSFRPNYPLRSSISMSNETTSKLSYPYPHGFQPSESFKPKAVPHPYDFPIGGDTIQSLSYALPALPVKEQYPWTMRRYRPSNVKMANDTIYQLSYPLPGEFSEK